MPKEATPIRIKRLLYQSWYRGCKETDRILGHFARAHLATFSAAELDRFEQLLQEEDVDLFAWITGKKPLPPAYQQCHVMQQLQDFHVPTALQSMPDHG